ncbi:unnamed protein product [Caenorhabditis auriculariae]|uniref:Fungal lipase-type domain-containing protein n=1 Tax=Caenorhabditis auriculariae TaxID=2777116 RepID=A0A8S1H3U8_9PELO|nr:unnamed protein product [Caenorhabditis auriculariae]
MYQPSDRRTFDHAPAWAKVPQLVGCWFRVSPLSFLDSCLPVFPCVKQLTSQTGRIRWYMSNRFKNATIACFLLLLPVTVAKKVDFDEERARVALEFAATAYAIDPVHCLVKNRAFILYQIRLPCDYMKDECWGLIALTKKQIIVSFRGTKSKEQLVTELVESIGKPKHRIHAGGSVHYYFYSALRAIWPQMSHLLHFWINMLPHKEIIFTGHSLGGALASLASTIFVHKFPEISNRTHLITFGQPRVGNFEYAQTHDRLIPSSWRLVHGADIVPHVPMCVESVKRPISCIPFYNHGSYHHGTEIWFPNEMSDTDEYRICTGDPVNEDNSCSNSHRAFDIFDHLFYFGHHVSDYGNNGCIEPESPRNYTRKRTKLWSNYYKILY